jgi:hypothetical protein
LDSFFFLSLISITVSVDFTSDEIVELLFSTDFSMLAATFFHIPIGCTNTIRVIGIVFKPFRFFLLFGKLRKRLNISSLRTEQKVQDPMTPTRHWSRHDKRVVDNCFLLGPDDFLISLLILEIFRDLLEEFAFFSSLFPLFFRCFGITPLGLLKINLLLVSCEEYAFCRTYIFFSSQSVRIVFLVFHSIIIFCCIPSRKGDFYSHVVPPNCYGQILRRL